MNQPKCTPVTNCGLCGSQNLLQVLDFGECPSANAYLKKTDSPNPSFPLRVLYCASCYCVQLGDVISSEYLFSEYLYASSSSGNLVKYFEGFAADVLKVCKNAQKILDVGANDGVLLKAFKKHNLNLVLGVDPAENLCKIANADGLVVKNAYFTHKFAQDLKKEYGDFDLITCTNCFAHIRDLQNVINGVKECLPQDGVFIIENAYLWDTLLGKQFPQIYSDHLYYHSILPLVKFFSENLMEIFKVERTSAQDGSIRVYVKRMGNNKYQVGQEVIRLCELERQNISFKTFYRLKEDIEELKQQINVFFNEAKNNKKTVAVYGCPAKLQTLSHVLGFRDIQYIADDSPWKQGLLTPDGKFPIVSRKWFIDNPPDYCIIGATNFKDLIIEKNPQFKGKWVNVLPHFEII